MTRVERRAHMVSWIVLAVALCLGLGAALRARPANHEPAPRAGLHGERAR